ncbi:methylglyoxal synthase [Streptomyces sp. NPDC001904]|uniref:methylglyoxal synthase n=1 Tax=Streptomyces sp. NPDC001904 TaxID=3154531 RepID=UPI00331EA915
MIALVAHDGRKKDLVEWARCHRGGLANENLVGTRSTAELLREELDLPVRGLASGPSGGDQQIGAAIVAGEVSVLVFFWDPLWAAPHGDDVRALLRIATLHNVTVAVNPASADAMLSIDLAARAA